MRDKIRKWLEKAHAGLRLSMYPPCDHLNTALLHLLGNPDKNRMAIEEICFAIMKADGYYYNAIAEGLVMNGFAEFVEGVKVDEDHMYGT